jgi:hypothetical protein
MGQEFEERDATRSCSQILMQQRLGQPKVLSYNRFVGERFKCLPGGDEAAQPHMEGGEQPSGLRIVRVKPEQLFQGSRRPAILAGVHIGDGFLEKGAFLAVADNSPFMHAGGSLFVSFLGGVLVGPHVTTLADHGTMQSGSPGHFT